MTRTVTEPDRRERAAAVVDVTARGAADIGEAATGAAATCAGSTTEVLTLAARLGRDPTLSAVGDDQLLDGLCRGAAELAASTCRWLVLLGEVVVRRLWAVDGSRTPAVWLSWRLGIAPATARDHVRVAVRLRELPAVRERFAAGTLSYSKVRAITRVATTETEQLLLRWADAATAAELERIVADSRRVLAAASRPAGEERDDLGLTRRWRDDTLEITIRLDAADGVVAEQHLDRMTALAHDGDGDAVPRRRRAADAVLGALAAAVDAAPADTSGLDRHLAVVELTGHDLLAAVEPDRPGEPADAAEAPTMARSTAEAPTTTSDAAEAPTPTASAAAVAPTPMASAAAEAPPLTPERTEAVAVVGSGRGGSRRRAVPLRQLRRLLCTSALDVLVALDRPVDLGRTRRDPDTRLRRLVHARDRSCRMPGCGATRWLHVHHVVPWEHGGPTDLDNLVLLCAHHHRVVHADGWHLRRAGPGRWTFHGPDATGRLADLPRPAASPPAAALSAAVLTVLAERARRRDPSALLPPDRDGLGHDHELTVEVLVDRLTAALPRQQLSTAA